MEALAEASKLIQIKVSGSAADRLEDIKNISGDTTKQVFMNTLLTYEALKKLPKGSEIVIEKPDGTKERLIVP